MSVRSLYLGVAAAALLQEEAFPCFGQAGQLLPGWLRGGHCCRDHQPSHYSRDHAHASLKHCLTSLSLAEMLTETVLIDKSGKMNFTLTNNKTKFLQCN